MMVLGSITILRLWSGSEMNSRTFIVGSIFLEYLETAMARPGVMAGRWIDLAVDLGAGHQPEAGLAHDDRLARVAHALAGAGPRIEQRDLALHQHGLGLFGLEEQHAGRVVRHRPYHLLERAQRGRGVDQRLHVGVEVLAAVGEEPRPPPVIRVAAARGLVGGAGAEQLVVGAVPAPAVEELGGVVPLLPGLGRLQVVLVLVLEFLLVVGPLEGDLVPEHHVHVAVVGHARRACALWRSMSFL